MKNQTEFFYFLPSLDLKHLEYYTIVKKLRYVPFIKMVPYLRTCILYDDILQARNQMTVPHSQSKRQL